MSSTCPKTSPVSGTTMSPSWTKHGHEFPWINSPSEFSTFVQSVMQSGVASGNVRHLSNGRTAFWDEATGTVIIVDPSHVDLGTVFRPPTGIQYFLGLK